jgi:hypothetical protein
MQKPGFEVARAIRLFGKKFLQECAPNSFVVRTLDALAKCRTAALGGHAEKCDGCGHIRYSYNSCKNRNCPKCQSAKQAFWVEDRVEDALNVKHFHIVFTIPDKLNKICLLDNRWFYNTMFACVWDTLKTFGYSHYGVETGAICVLHTWGQTLSFHPHIHCIVPAAGINIRGKTVRISKGGRFLFPVRMLSKVFRAKLMQKVNHKLKQAGLIDSYRILLNQSWHTDWNVFCEPPMGNAGQIVKYLGQYTHRVAITNHRIKNIDESSVTFSYKDYADHARQKLMRLSGVEFLRRFSMHILPYRFVKIRYYGIYSSRAKALNCDIKRMKIKPAETTRQRLLRLTGYNICLCPVCRKGMMHVISIIPRIRSPENLLYKPVCVV